MLSIVLATYNEEKNIRKCLQSIKDIADEIIVVDGSSSDNTKKLAQEEGARVITTTNKPNFHINKQMAMDEAKGELVLQLDADEWPDKELKKFIVSVHKKIKDDSFQKTFGKTVAWQLKRKNFFLGTYLKKGGQYPDPVTRLYLNGKAKLPQKDVHEQMVVYGELDWADGHLIHYANPTFNDYLRKFNTYTSFKAQQLKDEKLKINFTSGIKYIILKPIWTFLLLFFRHKGFVDGVAGFVFAAMSGMHHPVGYLKLWEIDQLNNIKVNKNKRKND